MVFAVPTYFFVVMMFLTLIMGMVRHFSGTLGVVQEPPPMEMVGLAQPLTLFLLLRVHQRHDRTDRGGGHLERGPGVPSAAQPQRRHHPDLDVRHPGFPAGRNHLPGRADRRGALGRGDVISQLARTVDGGRDIIYLLTMAGTTIILVMAANTSFAGFPRLAALLAIDGFLPRQLSTQGSRLVYSRGITVLTLLSIGFIVAFQASVTALIPLYAIGVFLSFTLSQAGMVHRWWKSGRLAPGQEVAEQGSTLAHDRGWRAKLAFNTVGAVATGMVTLIFAATKFREGAWIVLVVLPLLMGLTFRIHRHYRGLSTALSLQKYEPEMRSTRHRVILLISGVHKGTLRALRYAQLLSSDVTVVHISVDPEETARVQHKWEEWGEGVRLVILDSPYRLMLEPIVEYIEYIASQRQPNDTITIIVPHFVPRGWFDNLLHSQTAMILRLRLLRLPNIVVTDVPYQVT